MCAALALGAGTAAHGQEADTRTQVTLPSPTSTTPAPRRTTSRISPPQPGVPVINVVAATPTSPPSPLSVEEEIGRISTAQELMGALQMCTDVVSPEFAVNTRPLVEDQWGYTQPERVSNAMGEFETVSYHKDNLTIALQDFGPVVQCRVGARIEGTQSLAGLRIAIEDHFGAEPMAEAPRMQAMFDRIMHGLPHTDPANLLVTGEYSFELSTRDIDTTELGISDPPSITLLLITSMPLPPQFQTG